MYVKIGAPCSEHDISSLAEILSEPATFDFTSFLGAPFFIFKLNISCIFFKGNDRERIVTNEDLQRLEYLSCVMKESQRMTATVPIIFRQLERDMETCEYIMIKERFLQWYQM